MAITSYINVPISYLQQLYLLPSDFNYLMTSGASSISGSGSYGIQSADLSYGQLSLLTLQAVFQTVIICFLGFTAARTGLLNPVVQKYISNLNVQIFTPCLIFSKLASSLSLSALFEVSIIPLFFVVTTGVSYLCARVMSRILKLNKPETNFVTAMGVFGNSNSLPVSLTVALAYTLPNLTWARVEDDNPDKVASRGILYLLIFQQLGQVLRWSWGYNTLLAKPTEGISNGKSIVLVNDEENQHPEENCEGENEPLLKDGSKYDGIVTQTEAPFSRSDSGTSSTTSLATTSSDVSHTSMSSGTEANTTLSNKEIASSSNLSNFVERLPVIGTIFIVLRRIVFKFIGVMNPPLWSMLLAVIVASVPALKYEFYERNGFVQNTLSSAIRQVGSIAIPLILVVLGSNLAPHDSLAPPSKNYKKIVFGSLISRIILPSFFLLPLIAMSVKYLEISILDDPIFLLVSFILTIAPPAIQLSQICQLNEIFEREMAGVLFWGYVVLTLPTTIIIVVASLETLEWAN